MMWHEKYKEEALSLFVRKFINWPHIKSIITTCIKTWQTCLSHTKPLFSVSQPFLCFFPPKPLMTNHNALIADAKASIGVAVRVPNQSLFSPGGGRYISIPRKKLVQKLEADPSQTRINTWIEAMRASSPTRTRPGNISSLPESDEEDEHSSWIAQHPSALSMFDEIAEASKGKQIVMFLDYDGTLSPIVEDPERAYMSDEVWFSSYFLFLCFRAFSVFWQLLILRWERQWKAWLDISQPRLSLEDVVIRYVSTFVSQSINLS